MDKPGITLTIKADGAAPWLVFNLDTPDQLEAAIDSVSDELLTKACTLGQHFAATQMLILGLEQEVAQAQAKLAEARKQHNGSPVVPSQPVQQQERTPTAWTPASSANPVTGQVPVQQQASAGAPVNGQPHPTGAACGNCGTVLTYASGIGRESQKPWKKWGCPNARRDNPCDPYTQWIR